MTTFEQAHKEVMAYIDGKVRAGINIDRAASEYVWQGIEKGDDGQGYMHAEIRGMDSVTGNPVAFDFTAVDEE